SASEGGNAASTSLHSPAAPSSGSSTLVGLSPGTKHTRISIIPPHAVSSASDNRHKSLSYLAKPLRRESRENALETLRKYDTVLIVDDSESMEGSLWEEAKEALVGLTSVAAEYDSDGLDIHFLNHTKSVLGVKDASRVEALFGHVRPLGLTPIGERLEGLLSDYLRNLERAQRRHDKGDSSALKQIKPVNFIVITDGCPTDDPESVIVAAARRLDAKHFPLTQVGIQFVQIGKSRKATAYLRELDDALSSHYAIRDIVDTTPYINMKITSDMLIKILLGGINRR
ncbi:hypothetical protein F5141DRAFT_969010, partial [Pisolithus sp. B1]